MLAPPLTPHPTPGIPADPADPADLLARLNPTRPIEHPSGPVPPYVIELPPPT